MKLKKENITIILVALLLTDIIKKIIINPIISKMGILDYNILYDGIYNWNFFSGLIIHIIIFLVICFILEKRRINK